MTRGVELPFPVLGRPLRPFHLMLAMSMVTIADVNLRQNSTPVSATIWGDAIGVVAAVAAVLLALGWWLQQDRLADEGLALATGVWAARSMVYILTNGGWLGVGLSLAWTVGALGAWMLESYDHRWKTRSRA